MSNEKNQSDSSSSDNNNDKSKSQQAEKLARFDALAEWVGEQKGEDIYQKPTDKYLHIIASHYSHPLATDEPGELGARQAGNVILHTGQLHYQEALVELNGNLPLNLTLHYLSRDPHHGMFGQHWRLEYETRLIQINNNAETSQQNEPSYQLQLIDGRRFDFTYDSETRRYQDQGNLGATLRKVESQNATALEYYEGKTAYYRDSRFIGEIDRNSNRITLSYDQQGRLETIKNSAGAQLSFHYNNEQSQTLVSQINDHSGRTWQFDYDENYQQNQKINQQNHLQSDSGLLSVITTPSKGERHYSYHAHEEDSVSSETSKTSQLLTKASNSLGHALIECKYDKQGNAHVVREQGEGTGSLYRYQSNNSITVSTQDEQNTTYHLDEYGLIDSILYPNKNSFYLRWNERERRAKTERDGQRCEIDYFDDRNRLIKTINPIGAETSYTYEGNNPKPASIQSLTGESKNSYDDKHNLLNKTDAQGRITDQYKYDKKGNITEITDVSGNKTSYEYDASNNPVTITDEKGNSTHIEYDALGRESKLIDAEGRESQLVYNQDNSLSKIIDPLNHPIAFSYNEEGRLQSLSDPAGNTTRFEQDQRGRLVKQTRDDGKSNGYQYDAEGKITAFTHLDGSQIHFKHNDKGLLSHQITQEQTIEFIYDNEKNLIEARNQDSSLKLNYDKASGEIDSEHQNGFVVNRAYANSKKVSLSFLDQQLSYVQSVDGLLKCILTGDENSIQFTYNAQNSPIERQYANQQQEKINYDDSGSLIKIETADQEITYQTDKTDYITQKGNTQYAYDDSGRVIRAGKEHYAYDVLGNLTSLTTDTDDKNKKPFINRYHPKTNQLLENASHLFGYDGRGNLNTKTHKASKAIQHFTFNGFNQLTRVNGEYFDETTQSKTGIDLQYQYDGLKRRISKIENANSGQSKTEHYLYDQSNIIAILDENKQTVATIIHDEAIDTPLSISNKNGTFYYHRDHQGSIIALTNEQGDVVETIQYDDSYGKIIKRNKKIETNNPYCYTGREQDTPELYYYRARYYDPTSQQFLSEDPIGFLGEDVNFYRYVANDPINLMDPNGMSGCTKVLKKPMQKIGSMVGSLVGRALGGILGTAGTTACAAVTMGGCAVGGPLIIGGASTAGALGGKVAGKAAGGFLAKPACKGLAMLANALKAVSKTGARVKGESKDVDCGDYGVYKDQKNPKKKGLEKDHMPSTAAMKKATAKKLNVDVTDLSDCLQGALDKNGRRVGGKLKQLADTLAMPKPLHEKGRTNGRNPKNGSNTPEKIEQDSQDLGEAAKNDAEAYEEQLDDGDVPEECKEALKEKLADIKKMTHEDFMGFIDEMIKMCKGKK